MSTQLSNPIASMFELHRTFVQQNQAFVHDAIEAQQSAFEASRQGLDAWRAITQQNADFARAMSEASIANLNAIAPRELEGVEETQELLEEQLERIEDASEEGLTFSEAALDEASEAYAEFVEAYLEAVDSGVEAYLEATEDLEATADSVAESIDVE